MNDLGEIILFQTEHGQTRIDGRLVGETVWRSASHIADEAARVLVEQQYETYRRNLDAHPSAVEVCFDEAVKGAKQLAQPKKTGKKKGGGV